MQIDKTPKLTPEQHHQVLFYSPVLKKLLIPFSPDGVGRSFAQPSGVVGQGSNQ